MGTHCTHVHSRPLTSGENACKVPQVYPPAIASATLACGWKASTRMWNAVLEYWRNGSVASNFRFCGRTCVIVSTCCMLHNMLLDYRMQLHGGWSLDEVSPPYYRHPNDTNPRTNLRRVTDATNFFELVSQFGADYEAEVGGGYHEWRNRQVHRLLLPHLVTT